MRDEPAVLTRTGWCVNEAEPCISAGERGEPGSEPGRKRLSGYLGGWPATCAPERTLAAGPGRVRMQPASPALLEV